MSNELEKSRGVSNPLVLIQAAIEKGIDPEQLSKLLDLQERWEKNQAAAAFADAITAFQSQAPMVGKSRSANDKDGRAMYSYAAFEDIWRVVKPFLNANAIAVTFDTCPAEGMLSVTCKVRVGIHVETSSLVLPIPPATARCNATQAMASATSYGKRYALCSALGIVTADEDDDAQSVTAGPMSGEELDEIAELIEDREQSVGKRVNIERFSAIFGGTSLETIPRARFADACAQLRNDIANARKNK